MNLWEIVLIAVGLSMDAFAVSATLGLSVEKPRLREILLPGLYFGAFQALMPTAGYGVGVSFAQKIQAFDHWIAFVLLALIGGKMIKDSFAPSPEDTSEAGKPGGPAFGVKKMLLLAFATSIDALTVGVTYALLKVDIVSTALLTGGITLIISMAGVQIGHLFGAKFKTRAAFAGGLVLLLLGTKILVEHLLF